MQTNPEIRVAPKDVILHEAQVKSKRLDEKTRMNLQNMLLASLRGMSAMKIKIEALQYEDETASIVASYDFKGESKKGTFNFEKDRLSNWHIVMFDSSIRAAETVVVEEVKINPVMIDQNITFDLSAIKAIQRGDEYQIEYPAFGKLGHLKADAVTEDSIKVLFAAAASDLGMKAKFTGTFKVEYHNQDYTVDLPTYAEAKSSDTKVQARNDMIYFQKEQSEDKFAGLREAFAKTIKIKASTLVKQFGTTYKTGIPQITEVESFIEMKDGIYSGNVLVKAKMKEDIVTFALPIVRGKIEFKGDLNKYRIDTKKFHDIVKTEMDKRLKATLQEHIKVIVADEMNQRAQTVDALKGGRQAGSATQFKIAKVNLPDAKLGMVLNLSGADYEVTEGTNPAYWVLKLATPTT